MKTLSLAFQSNSDLVASKDLKYKLLYFGIHFGDKAKQPFEVIPVLTVIRPDNNNNNDSNNGSDQQELVLAENMAIDLFLAKQFGLHGENAWEEAVIKCKVHFPTGQGSMKNNHLNGHYVGNWTTLADIRTTTLLDSFSKIIGKARVAQVVNETATPGIIKVVKNVENQPSYKAWIESEEYKKRDAKSMTLVKEHPEL
ncbi:MAG: hypothetical protein J3Q66DRAFT_440721 [Benniella sp.]|nr:MAG: hypothetical protein J3Q66DRAFT_440721 [Benniella sp.]